MAVYAGGCALVLGLALAALLRAAPPWDRTGDALRAPRRPAPPAVRRLWLPYVINALAVAIPGTLVLFYIADQIVRPDLAPAYLATYFVAGAAGMPGWTWLSRRIGPARAWAVAMALAVSMFFWALFLGPGDALAFGAVCLLSGLALGADLVLPPVLLAAAIPADQDPAAHYGIWTLLGKLATAVSALTLPLLAWLGYRPGAPGAGGHALAIAYAAIPCALKLTALSLLIVLVIAKEERTP
jgi:Na+/melibiose symporter-like transporter